MGLQPNHIHHAIGPLVISLVMIPSGSRGEKANRGDLLHTMVVNSMVRREDKYVERFAWGGLEPAVDHAFLKGGCRKCSPPLSDETRLSRMER